MDRTNTIAELPAIGRVALVGAGPGDPDLLTIRAFRLLRRADVVLHDNLVSEEVLQLAAGSRLVPVGKIGGGRHTPQETINGLLLAEAKAGRAVVRLKGGDPFVFGRGSEEAIFLAAHGVPVEVVPGITSAVAAAGSAGIPVTHRGINTHFSVVAGRGARDDDALRQTWRSLAATGGTVVFMMGLGRLEEIVGEVLAAGVPADRAMAVISAATTDCQRTVEGTVSTIVAAVHATGISAPATIILGDVVSVRSRVQAAQLDSIVHSSVPLALPS